MATNAAGQAQRDFLVAVHGELLRSAPAGRDPPRLCHHLRCDVAVGSGPLSRAGQEGEQEMPVPVHMGTGSPPAFTTWPCSAPSSTSPEPPTIADDLTDVAVTRLSPAVLTCYASGVPPPMVRWSKDGAQLGSRGGGYHVLPTGMAQHCAPRGAWSSMPASPWPLPSLSSVPSCLLSSQGPWRSGGHCLHTLGTTPALPGAWLAQLGSTSSSWCTVCRAHPGGATPCALVQPGGALVGSISLPFTEPPALKPLPGMVMVMVNTSAVLSCEATGVPRPELSWQKDGVGITGGEWEPTGC